MATMVRNGFKITLRRWTAIRQTLLSIIWSREDYQALAKVIITKKMVLGPEVLLNVDFRDRELSVITDDETWLALDTKLLGESIYKDTKDKHHSIGHLLRYIYQDLKLTALITPEEEKAICGTLASVYTGEIIETSSSESFEKDTLEFNIHYHNWLFVLMLIEIISPLDIIPSE
jgi:hypothetical protein